MKTIGLVPGSFKPYHAGHDGLVRIAAKENDLVWLFVSLTDRIRPGETPIYGKDMEKIWKEFIEPTLPDNVLVEYGGVPVQQIYNELETAEESGEEDVIYRIYSDSEDVLKYTDASLSKAAPILFANDQIERRGVARTETVPVSGTEMRSYLKSGDIEKFIALLPPAVRKNGTEIFKILIGKQSYGK